jgi:hypothetical protein
MKFAKPFLSTFVNKVDAKGRVSVPARFREILEGQGVRAVYARASTSGPAIVAGGLDWMEQQHAAVAAHDPSSEIHDDFAYALLGDTVELGVDGEGMHAGQDTGADQEGPDHAEREGQDRQQYGPADQRPALLQHQGGVQQSRAH